MSAGGGESQSNSSGGGNSNTNTNTNTNNNGGAAADYYGSTSTQHLTQRHQRSSTAAEEQGSSSSKQQHAYGDNDDNKYNKNNANANVNGSTGGSLSKRMQSYKLVLVPVMMGFLTSLLLVGRGYHLAFHTHPVQTIFRCEPQGCTYRETHDNGDHSVLHLHRHQLKRTELVRLDRRTREVVQYLTGPRRKDHGSSSGAGAHHDRVDRIVHHKNNKPSMFTYCPDTYVTYSLVFDDEEEHHQDLYNEYQLKRQTSSSKSSSSSAFQFTEYLMVPHSKDASEQSSTLLFHHLDLTNTAHGATPNSSLDDNAKAQRAAYTHLLHYIAGKRTQVKLEQVHNDAIVTRGFHVMSVGVVLFCITLIAWQWSLLSPLSKSTWNRPQRHSSSSSSSATTPAVGAGVVEMGDHHQEEEEEDNTDEDYDFTDHSDDNDDTSLDSQDDDDNYDDHQNPTVQS
jgi:hypothetical protein